MGKERVSRPAATVLQIVGALERTAGVLSGIHEWMLHDSTLPKNPGRGDKERAEREGWIDFIMADRLEEEIAALKECADKMRQHSKTAVA